MKLGEDVVLLLRIPSFKVMRLTLGAIVSLVKLKSAVVADELDVPSVVVILAATV